ncbi:uncharacterized protein LOC126627018 isoform X1 [Malus sylvestris]|nr:uncharacterized protein LOC103437921 isoform X1 [Malus domestica]XP_050152392.1 uncharacterized protein LOC126627018 isoform X1 [Malus sylvestris]XP_050152393.1 uncharacterized protein LOC126627018 isoform X1 [Malus sylvestris]
MFCTCQQFNRVSMDGHSTMVFQPVYNSFKFKNSEAMKGLKVEKSTSSNDDNLFISDLQSQDSEVVLNPHPDDSQNMRAIKEAVTAGDCAAWKDSARKAAMDYDLPELVAFLQGSSNYQLFKDICIDKEVRCKDKCSVENCEFYHSSTACMLDSDPDSESESIRESLDSESSTSTDENDCKKDDLSNDHSIKKIISEKVFLVGQGPSNAVLAANSMGLSITMGDNRRTSNASVKGDLENTSGSAEFHAPEMENMLRHDSSEDGMSDGLAESSQRHQHCSRGSSSSAYELPSGSFSYSGRIPGFGSISFRSSSSTTSSRSFSFPILSSEWNGSPARMGSADHRQLHRHRHWGMRFLCCKF